ncbi:hypothetical protein Poly24_06490 [Rosistilla carotiformis]|uniref:Uncharacterized protein n=1 Tax=Rosistilla carotiformis TaxID=2528017 RepID=A0A518JN35_9BACT|nr:hypothetical protein Poly24_06490 [Rosistilla carotiformis]
MAVRLVEAVTCDLILFGFARTVARFTTSRAGCTTKWQDTFATLTNASNRQKCDKYSHEFIDLLQMGAVTPDLMNVCLPVQLRR